MHIYFFTHMKEEQLQMLPGFINFVFHMIVLVLEWFSCIGTLAVLI
jgi:hypothetical protein